MVLFHPQNSLSVKRLLLPLFISLLSLSSCTEDPPLTLYYQDRERIDSIFMDSVSVLRPQLDSLCDARFDSAVQFHVDSLLKVRLEEIQKYMERIQDDNEQ